MGIVVAAMTCPWGAAAGALAACTSYRVLGRDCFQACLPLYVGLPCLLALVFFILMCVAGNVWSEGPEADDTSGWGFGTGFCAGFGIAALITFLIARRFCGGKRRLESAPSETESMTETESCSD
eukprot:TRINITY_DN27188_c0_g4_i1.p1 TRINITY_DN27188_c0_g4~~TRINITY_DN27188_c0_g4_i1.p1  ORF type:complete len:124 (-),score=16.09 TRINITY_DN27188_c0_g4_i1:176-547(-)